MRIWLIVATVAAMAGCGIGGGLVAENRTSYNQFTLRPARGVVEPGRGPSSLTAAAIVGAWGDPDSKDVDGDCEVWRYHRELAVSGIVAWLILPIPLVVPTGWRDTAIYLVDGIPVGAEREFGDWSLVGCGLLIHAGGCGVHNRPSATSSFVCSPTKVPTPAAPVEKRAGN